MAKVDRPLWSDEATGRIGLSCSFKNGAVWSSIIPQFNRVQPVSLPLQSQRAAFGAACAAWQLLTPGGKQYYIDNAPAHLTGFQYYLQTVL